MAAAGEPTSRGRFVQGPYAHNARTALALVPAFLLALGSHGTAGGGVSTGLMLVAGVAAYVLESARASAAAIGVIWATPQGPRDGARSASRARD